MKTLSNQSRRVIYFILLWLFLITIYLSVKPL